MTEIRNVVAGSLLALALGILIAGARAFLGLWSEVRPELCEGPSTEAAHYRHLKAGNSGMVWFSDFLDDIWTPRGRALRRRVVAFTVLGIVFLWMALAHWLGTW